MFVRTKQSGKYRYLQIVQNHRDGGQVRQQVIVSLGRFDQLRDSGQLDNLTRSLSRLCRQVSLIDAQRQGSIESRGVRKLGPALVFERLWQSLGISKELSRLLAERKFGFAVERAVFVTVLHRLFASGSDRQAEQWYQEHLLEGVAGLSLQHFYRAMAWLGEELPPEEQQGATPFSPRCTKELIEEGLFARRRDLFSNLDVVFFDTTSIYFEGEGGEQLGRRGNSKDHRPDLKQMVVGVVLDSDGRPVCCELWPGNTTDVKSLLPVVKRLRQRFAIGSVCVVADRGMISQETIARLEELEGLSYILGARMRKQKEVRSEVLSRGGRYQQVEVKGKSTKAPAPLQVKEVLVSGRRYIVCYNEDQARKDAADREAIVAGLRDKLKGGARQLVGNKGYRKYLKARGEAFVIDQQRIKEEARYDGKWVLRTNTDLSSKEVAVKYKQLWMVEQVFRTSKSILRTRPIFHKCDETIRGHVFCSFLALMLMIELQQRLEQRGLAHQWNDLRRDLEALQETEVAIDNQTYYLRTPLRGTCLASLRAAGVAPPPAVRQ
jgi:transposase